MKFHFLFTVACVLIVVIARYRCRRSICRRKCPISIPPHRYLLGNSVGMAVGETCGEWTMLYGAGRPNEHDLRSLETGVNISAIAKYWNLGQKETQK